MYDRYGGKLRILHETLLLGASPYIILSHFAPTPIDRRPSDLSCSSHSYNRPPPVPSLVPRRRKRPISVWLGKIDFNIFGKLCARRLIDTNKRIRRRNRHTLWLFLRRIRLFVSINRRSQSVPQILTCWNHDPHGGYLGYLVFAIWTGCSSN